MYACVVPITSAAHICPRIPRLKAEYKDYSEPCILAQRDQKRSASRDLSVYSELTHVDLHMLADLAAV